MIFIGGTVFLILILIYQMLGIVVLFSFMLGVIITCLGVIAALIYVSNKKKVDYIEPEPEII